MDHRTPSLAEQQEAESFRHVRKRRGFYIHLFQYLVIVSILTLVNLVVSPQRLWVLWVIGGWGLGLLMHGFSVFRSTGFLGAEWERAQVEKRLGRPLS